MILKRRLAFVVWTPGGSSVDAEGYPIKTWTSGTAYGDIQPVSNSQRVLADFGKDTVAPDSRILFGSLSDTASIGYSSVVQYGSAYYEVVGIAPWYMHSEILLQPYKGALPS